MSRFSTAILTVLVALAAGASATNDLPQTLTLAPNACTGFEWTGLQDDFDYTVQLTSVEAQPDCNVTVSKFYAQGACVGSRQNDIGLSGTVKDLTCAKVEDNTASTCSEVFTSGPKDALIASSTISQGQTFDSGKACYSSDRAYVFVKSTCDTPVKISATLSADKYTGGVCVSTKGWHLGGVAIALIVVASLIAAVLLVLCCCCCCSRCR